jgi:hypothetical protein
METNMYITKCFSSFFFAFDLKKKLHHPIVFAPTNAPMAKKKPTHTLDSSALKTDIDQDQSCIELAGVTVVPLYWQLPKADFYPTFPRDAAWKVRERSILSREGASLPHFP